MHVYIPLLSLAVKRSLYDAHITFSQSAAFDSHSICRQSWTSLIQRSQRLASACSQRHNKRLARIQPQQRSLWLAPAQSRQLAREWQGLVGGDQRLSPQLRGSLPGPFSAVQRPHSRPGQR